MLQGNRNLFPPNSRMTVKNRLTKWLLRGIFSALLTRLWLPIRIYE